MSRIFLVGDIHGSHSISKLNTKNFPIQKELTKEDVVIQMGDFGNYWAGDKEEAYWLDWLAAKNFTFAFLDGNHENHQMIWDLPLEEKWGGLVNVDHRTQGSIYHLRRGEVYTINNKKFLVIGGAQSHDKHLRTIGKDWWETELLSRADEENALNNIDLHNRKFDHVLSHTVPEHVVLEFTESSTRLHDPVAKFLGFIENLIDYKSWHIGHFHNDRSVGKIKCHYLYVHELKD